MGYTVKRVGQSDLTARTVQEIWNLMSPGDTVVADPDHYPGDTLATSKPGKLTVDRGEAIYSAITNGKSTFVLSGPGPFDLEYLVGDAIRNSSGNGGLVRSDVTGRLTLNRCRGLPKCQTWLLTGPSPTAVVELFDCHVHQAGAGDGQSHAVYVAGGSMFRVKGGSYIDTDGWNTGSAGHLLKWLSQEAHITDVYLDEGRASRALSAEYGGIVLIDGSTVVIQDLLKTGNFDMLGYGGQLGGTGFAPKYLINTITIGEFVKVIGISPAGFIRDYIKPAGTTIIVDERGKTYPPIKTEKRINFSTMIDGEGPYEGDLVYLKFTDQIKPVPVPVDAVMSEWSPWATTGELTPCVGGHRTVTQTRTRVLLTRPMSGGLPAGPLVETRELVEECTPVPSGLPAWMPEAGRIKVRSTSKILDVDPCPARNCAYSGVAGTSGTFDWCGTGFAPTVGEYGSFVHTGGGHNSNYDNSIYQYDLATGLFTRPKDPYPNPTKDAQGLVIAHPISCEFLDSEGNPVPNEPFTAHTYDSVKFMAPNLMGTNTKGYQYTGIWQKSSNPHYGPQRWVINLDTMRYEKFGSPSPAGINFVHHPVVIDTKRRRIVEADAGGLTPYGMNIDTGVWSRLTPTFRMFASFDRNADYFAAADLYVSIIPAAGTWNLILYNPDTFESKVPVVIGEVPHAFGGGEWVESRGGYYAYCGAGSSVGDLTVYKIAPTGNPWSDPWVGTKEVLAADETVPQRVSHIRHYSRFRHVPALNYFAWLASASAKVFTFNPSI